MLIQPITPSSVPDVNPATTGYRKNPGQAVQPTGDASSQPESEASNPAKIDAALRQINAVISRSAIELRYSVDAETKKIVVRLVDQNSQEVIRQIPPQEVLAIAHGLDRMQGLLVRRKV